MAEEHGFQAPEGHRLCANNCGFFGSSATGNFCSKCYRDICLKEDQEKASANALFSFSQPQPSPVQPQPATTSAVPVPERVEPAALTAVAQPAAQATNRCTTCRKKVGLTGFRCRCGTTFCGTHRYPEKHGCTFDFKAMGREEIARANPVVKAEKLEKI